MTLKELLSGRPKIIARTKNGKCFKGYLRDGRFLTRGILRMTTVDSQELPVDLNQLKGVFFVRDFEGNKNHLENKILLADPERPGLRVRLRFEDNETMEGVVENHLELLQAAGFFFWPADTEANNDLIFVMKSSLLGFRVLGVKG
ncbi:MAG: DUF6982 domain-containing protein [Vicinamibacteria bacterium]